MEFRPRPGMTVEETRWVTGFTQKVQMKQEKILGSLRSQLTKYKSTFKKI